MYLTGAEAKKRQYLEGIIPRSTPLRSECYISLELIACLTKSEYYFIRVWHFDTYLLNLNKIQIIFPFLKRI